MALTEVQRNAIYNRIRHFRMRGDPISALRLNEALEADVMPDASLMDDIGVHTDTPLSADADLTIPPRNGKGSGVKAWREFAAKVTDIDTEVLSRMDRGDIIGTLETRGNIPTEDDEDE